MMTRLTYLIVYCMCLQVEKLMIAKQHGCFDVIHCDEKRQYRINTILISRTA